MSDRPVLWSNARIATCDASMSELRGALLTTGGTIAWMGEEAALPVRWREAGVERHDLQGRWVTPGLIDCHTHLIFAGNRASEWHQLLRGATYEQIARAGGGIAATMTATRRTSEAELFEQAAPRLECLLAEGVTTVEIKSGYGLTLADERKMLKVARALNDHYPVTVRTTFLAAHAIPPEFAGRADEYIDEVAGAWLPALHQEGLVDAVDVFCERIGFDVAQSERLLAAAARLHLPIRMHAEQLSNIGATQLATRYRALSCDHLEYSNEEDVRAMARMGTVAVLLPTAFLHMGETKLPPIEALRQHGTAIAIASDCNPGSAPSPSLLLAASLATRLFRLTPNEALTGITRTAAIASGVNDDRGVLRERARADFVVWDVESLDEITYWIGRNMRAAVVHDGDVVAGVA
jgi:imidazolonepropionase